MAHDLVALLAAYMPEIGRGSTSRAWIDYKKSLFEIVGRHEGQVVDVDGEGWFVARFRNALTSTRCAVEIQRAQEGQGKDSASTESARLHIGLNHEASPKHGEIWPPEKDNTVDRLVALAEPGGICLSRTIYDDIRFQIDIPFDTTRDPKHTAFVCQEIRRKLGTLNLLESGAVRIGAAALARHVGKTGTRDTASGNGVGVFHRIRAYIDRNLLSDR